MYCGRDWRGFDRVALLLSDRPDRTFVETSDLVPQSESRAIWQTTFARHQGD